MNVEIVNTGSELLLGRVLNTHQQWLCRRFSDLGHEVVRQVTVADTAGAIRQAIQEALGRADLVVTTGGLGPTSDDFTREEVAGLLGCKLVANAAIHQHIEEYFAKRKRPRPARTSVEELVPEGAQIFLNSHGTAPGLALCVNPNLFALSKKPAWLVMLPGPPRELHPMFNESVAPFLHRHFPQEAFACLTLRSAGVGESKVQERIEEPLHQLVCEGLVVGYCARPGAVDVRLVARGGQAGPLVQEAARIVQELLGPSLYGRDDDELEDIVVTQLRHRKQTLALAESCTGGLLAHRITNIPGASEVFRGCAVTYANAVKSRLLGVDDGLMVSKGAVSEETARAMATGAQALFSTDYALSITGVAGPAGGTPATPVGTVFMALASPDGVSVHHYLNAWDRQTFKAVTTFQALDLLRKALI